MEAGGEKGEVILDVLISTDGFVSKHFILFCRLYHVSMNRRTGGSMQGYRNCPHFESLLSPTIVVELRCVLGISQCPASKVEVYPYKILLKRFHRFVAYLQSKRAPGWPRITAEAVVLWYCHALPHGIGSGRPLRGNFGLGKVSHRTRYNCHSS